MYLDVATMKFLSKLFSIFPILQVIVICVIDLSPTWLAIEIGMGIVGILTNIHLIREIRKRER